MQLQAAVRTISVVPLGDGACVCSGQNERHVDVCLNCQAFEFC